MTLLFMLTTLAVAQDMGDTEGPTLMAVPTDSVITFPNGGGEEEVMEPSLVLPMDPLSLSDGITTIPAGAFIALVKKDGSYTPRRVPGKSWLLPDSYYRTALTKSKQLDICQPALDRCTETSLAWQERTYEALEKASVQFDEDEGLVDELTVSVAEWETRALTAESKNRDLKAQRNTAWAVTGGLVLGAVAVTSVAIGI